MHAGPGALTVLSELERVLVDLASIMDRLGIPYAVGGSVASSRYGDVRSTNDVDVSLDLSMGKVRPLVQALSPGWYVEESSVVEALQRGDMFQAVHAAALFKADLYIADPHRILDKLGLARRQRVRVGGEEGGDVCFVSPEDIVLRKLDWLRASHDVLQRRRRDVLGVLKALGGSLDLAYLRSTAQGVGLEKSLESCLQDAGLAP